MIWCYFRRDRVNESIGLLAAKKREALTQLQCTVFRKASILSGSGFNKFLASQNFFRENATG